MTEPSLPELEAERDRLYAQLNRVGDFRRGSVTENWRKCGKPNCVCAQPDHPGHGPRFLSLLCPPRQRSPLRFACCLRFTSECCRDACSTMRLIPPTTW
jgi:hypothetical protein